MTPSLKIKFPFPEYNMVWEAEQYFLYGKGPLQEHGALKIRWGTVSHGEPQLREELAAWFKSNGTLTEENVDECLGIIDKYLQKEKNKQDAEDDARGDLKESSLKEQMVFLSSMGSITPQRVRSFGLDPSIIRKAQIAKIIETTPNGTMRGNHYRGRLMEDDLEPGQSVYRIKDGKVQKVVVTMASRQGYWPMVPEAGGSVRGMELNDQSSASKENSSHRLVLAGSAALAVECEAPRLAAEYMATPTQRTNIFRFRCRRLPRV